MSVNFEDIVNLSDATITEFLLSRGIQPADPLVDRFNVILLYRDDGLLKKYDNIYARMSNFDEYYFAEYNDVLVIDAGRFDAIRTRLYNENRDEYNELTEVKFSDLPPEVLQLIALSGTAQTAKTLAMVNIDTQSIINNNYFWRQKIVKDFGEIPYVPDDSQPNKYEHTYQEIAQLLTDPEALLKTDNYDLTRLLIANGADVNAIDSREDTPLHLVKSSEVAELLIAKGADVNALNIWGRGPLSSTSSAGVAKVLIANGADINAMDRFGNTPLHFAKSGEVAEILIAKGIGIDTVNNTDNTPLHRAANVGVAKVLIDHGANIDARDLSGYTPLFTNEDSDVRILSIAKGADVNARSNDGTPLLTFVHNVDIVNMLIARGAVVDAVDNEGRTALFSVENIDVANVLLARGANIHAVDNNGNTPLHVVVVPDVVELFISRGADVHAKNNLGQTPLHTVGEIGETAELLITNGADVNAADDNWNTPLHTAESEDVAEVLIDKGADANAKNMLGQTPLHTLGDFAGDINVFFTGEVDINAQDDELNTPLHLVQHTDMAEQLLENGANILSTNDNGDTPLINPNVAGLMIVQLRRHGHI